MSRLHPKVVLAIAVAAVLVLAATAVGIWSYGMVTGTRAAISPGETHSLAAQSPAGASVDRSADRIAFSTSRVKLSLVSGAEGRPMMSFTAAGLVNPTIVVASGARVTVQLINADDDMPHGWLLTTAGPPYPYMGSMMGASGGAEGMMGRWGPMRGGAVVAPLPAAGDHDMAQSSVTFTAPSPGTYWYLCQVPGHAEQGMYGRFQVT